MWPSKSRTYIKLEVSLLCGDPFAMLRQGGCKLQSGRKGRFAMNLVAGLLVLQLAAFLADHSSFLLLALLTKGILAKLQGTVA